MRSQFPAPGEGCAESAAGVMGDPTGSNHRPFLAFAWIDAQARDARGLLHGKRANSVSFRTCVLLDGMKRVCVCVCIGEAHKNAKVILMFLGIGRFE